MLSKTNIIKGAIALLLIISIAFVGTQYYTVFGSSTGIYYLQQDSFEADIGDTITVTGKAWITDSGTYKVGMITPNYLFVDDAATKTYSNIVTAGYWQFSIPITIDTSNYAHGEYSLYLTKPDGSRASGEKSFTITAPSTTPPDVETPLKPSDYCDGTTKVTHYLSGNTWVPDYTQNSIDCGYIEPETTASLFIDASPDGTLVIDGVPRGTTPITVDNLEIGTHIISIQLDGYKEIVEQVTITAGANSEAFYLEKITTDEPDEDGTDDEPTDEGTDWNSSLITILLVMMLVVVVLGGTYVYVKSR